MLGAHGFSPVTTCRENQSERDLAHSQAILLDSTEVATLRAHKEDDAKEALCGSLLSESDRNDLAHAPALHLAEGNQEAGSLEVGNQGSLSQG